MKTSNKILLGLFIGAFLILSAVHATLYSKYKSGDFTYVTDNIWQPNLASFSLQDVKYVSVEGLSNVTIRPSDTLRLQYEGPDKGKTMDFGREGDTLVVRAIKASGGNNYGTPVSIYVNETVPVWIRHGNVTLKGAKDSASARSLSLNLDYSFLQVSGGDGIPYLRALTINANASTMKMDALFARNVSLSLRNAHFEETGSTFESFSAEGDVASRLSLGASNFTKAKINQND